MEAKKLNLTLNIWRQKNSKSVGSFAEYKVQVSPDASFLEMLDELKRNTLIAAAPDLLTGCVYALNELKFPHPNPENIKLTIEYLEQAIAKAEGR